MREWGFRAAGARIEPRPGSFERRRLVGRRRRHLPALIGSVGAYPHNHSNKWLPLTSYSALLSSGALMRPPDDAHRLMELAAAIFDLNPDLD